MGTSKYDCRTHNVAVATRGEEAAVLQREVDAARYSTEIGLAGAADVVEVVGTRKCSGLEMEPKGLESDHLNTVDDGARRLAAQKAGGSIW